MKCYCIDVPSLELRLAFLNESDRNEFALALYEEETYFNAMYDFNIDGDYLEERDSSIYNGDLKAYWRDYFNFDIRMITSGNIYCYDIELIP
jgi:hypothetical protein